MFEEENKQRLAAKWVISVAAACILLYLGVRHIGTIAKAVLWVIDLVEPLLIGTILALIFNVPMSAIEHRIFRKQNSRWSRKAQRRWSILLSLLLVLGLFFGIALLVIPELINAVTLIAQIAMGSLDWMSGLESSVDLSQLPFGTYLMQIDIDWNGLQLRLEDWINTVSETVMSGLLNGMGSLAGNLVSIFVGFVFCVYILSRKEKLKRQVCRLIRVWLPRRPGEAIIHIADVSNRIFRHFIAGQATEAIILGALCALGMLILRIPYAPMIGALVGVTALIPIVGAFIGLIVGAIMILTVDPFKALVFVAFLLVLQQIEGNVIYPKVVGAKINLPAMWVLAAVTVGGNLAGPLGMLLGVPAASAVYALLREATNLREYQQSKME